jgi:ATP synthase I chain
MPFCRVYNPSVSEETSQSTDDFYSRALERIHKFMLVLGVAALITSTAMFGWHIGVGFAVGGAVSFLNFYWLKKVVAGLAAATVQSGTPASSRGVVHRFLLRYFLMAMAAFVILTVSRDSLYGFFAGLFLPVAAMLCEAGYETYKVVSGR